MLRGLDPSSHLQESGLISPEEVGRILVCSRSSTTYLLHPGSFLAGQGSLRGGMWLGLV